MLIVIPGPSVVFVIGRSLSYGRGVALASVLGNSLGFLVVLALVALGLGVVVQESVLVFTVLQLAGAAYLVWLGGQALRHRRAFTVPDLERTGPTRARAMRQGFGVGVSNPKAFVIFAAVLPQFVDRSAGHVQGQMLALGLCAFAIGLVFDGAWAVAASRLRDWFTASPRRGEAVGATGGPSMIGLGVGLAVSGRPG